MDVAAYVRRFLRHPAFATDTRRRGAIARLSPTWLHVWRPRGEAEEVIAWPT